MHRAQEVGYIHLFVNSFTRHTTQTDVTGNVTTWGFTTQTDETGNVTTWEIEAHRQNLSG